MTATRQPASFNRRQYDREIDYAASERERRAAAKQADEQRRQAIYVPVYAAEFAKWRGLGCKSWEAGNLARGAAASAVAEWRG